MRIQVSSNSVSSLVSLFIGLTCLFRSSTIVSACSFAECPFEQTLASTAPIDTTVELTIPANETCATVSLPLRCSGCASCDSNYIYSWPDSDLFNCSIDDRFVPSTESIPCSELVFGNLSSSLPIEDGHCGLDSDSGRNVCSYADSSMRGGIKVCLNSNDSDNATVVTSLMLRQVEYECTAPAVGPATSTNYTDLFNDTETRVPTGNYSSMAPTEAPTTNNNTSSPTAANSTEVPTFAPSDAPSATLSNSTTNRGFASAATRVSLLLGLVCGIMTLLWFVGDIIYS